MGAIEGRAQAEGDRRDFDIAGAEPTLDALVLGLQSLHLGLSVNQGSRSFLDAATSSDFIVGIDWTGPCT